MIADPYRVLGVPESVSDAELKQTYRNLSKKYHPDANPDDPERAEEKFKEVQEAYRQIIEARERGTSAYGPKASSYASPQPQKHESAAGSTYTYAEPFEADGFAFRDFYSQWVDQAFRAQNSQNTQSARRESYEEILTRAEQLCHAGNYSRALEMLNLSSVHSRTARWYYLSAVANAGSGNNATALEYAKVAADLEPVNRQYRDLLRTLQGSTARYQKVSNEDFGQTFTGISPICFSMAVISCCSGGELWPLIFCC